MIWSDLSPSCCGNTGRPLHGIYKSAIAVLSDERIVACLPLIPKKGKRKAQGVPQPQTAAPPRPQEEEETDKSKQAQIEQTFEKHQD